MIFLKQKTLPLVVSLPVLLCVFFVVCLYIPTTNALVPNIDSITKRDVGSTTWVDIVITHTAPPAIGPSHYVSMVELTVNGNVMQLSQSPQNTETFTVSESLGPNTNSYTVTARALCNVHGYSPMSSSVVVPESLSAVMLIALASVTLVLAVKLSRKNRK